MKLQRDDQERAQRKALRDVEDENNEFEERVNELRDKIKQVQSHLSGMYKERSGLRSKITKLHDDHKDNMELINDDEIKALCKYNYDFVVGEMNFL